MKKGIILLSLFLFVISGCAYNPPIYNPGTQIENNNHKILLVNYDLAFRNAIDVLYVEGFLIKVSDKENGIITTEKKHVILNELQVDCGNIWGLPYVKDKRTTLSAAYSVRLRPEGDNTNIIVTTNIDAIFNATANVETKELSCFSQGYLENKLIAEIEKIK